jgi:hypothetical protein
MLLKICTKCKIEKPLDDFSANSRNKTTGKQPKCKECNSAYDKANRQRNSKRTKLYRLRVGDEWRKKEKAYRDNRREKMRAYLKEYYAANRERLITKERARYERKRETILPKCREYAKNNRAKLNAIHSRRKAMQKQAIPSWADFDLIRSFYEKAKSLSKKTGVEYEVDHVVPIKSKIVCGLHCQQNLQILTADENNRKNNSRWPDMP